EHPPERMPLHSIPSLDESGDGASKDADVVMRAVPQHAAMQDREEQLDLVHPLRRDRCVVEVEPAAVSAIEASPPLHGAVKMDVQVVPDNVNLMTWAALRHPFHEFNEIRRSPLKRELEATPRCRYGSRNGWRRPSACMPVFSSTQCTTLSLSGLSRAR